MYRLNFNGYEFDWYYEVVVVFCIYVGMDELISFVY